MLSSKILQQKFKNMLVLSKIAWLSKDQKGMSGGLTPSSIYGRTSIYLKTVGGDKIFIDNEWSPSILPEKRLLLQ